MEPNEPLAEVRALIAFLRRHTLRTRIGLWRMPVEWVGQEPDTATRLQIGAFDIRQAVQQQLAEGTRYVHLTFEKILEALDFVASSEEWTDCALVYNLDLLLAGLKRDERQRVWESLLGGLPYRRRALLLAVPATATQVLPSEQLMEVWQREGRLV
jgi:hypothetical protein